MIYIDLDGPEGNSYNIMAIAKKLCKTLKIDSVPIINDMRSGNYEHLINVFLKHFDEYVVLGGWRQEESVED